MQDANDVLGARLLRGVSILGELLEPGRPGEQIRPGQGHLDGLARVLLEERDLIERQPGRLAPELADGHGALDSEGRNIESAQSLLEAGAVRHVVEQLGDGHEPHAFDLLHHEGVEVVAALFAVRDLVNAGLLLQAQRVEHGLVGNGVELLLGDLASLPPAQRSDQLGRTGPAAYRGHREQLFHNHLRSQSGERQAITVEPGASCMSSCAPCRSPTPDLLARSLGEAGGPTGSLLLGSWAISRAAIATILPVPAAGRRSASSVRSTGDIGRPSPARRQRTAPPPRIRRQRLMNYPARGPGRSWLNRPHPQVLSSRRAVPPRHRPSHGVPRARPRWAPARSIRTRCA